MLSAPRILVGAISDRKTGTTCFVTIAIDLESATLNF
jgi:hypothetical protein